jgi:hypothetical protein
MIIGASHFCLSSSSSLGISDSNSSLMLGLFPFVL